VHEHDGFYFRFALGGAGLSFAGDNVKSDQQQIDGASLDGKGFAIPVHIALGGTVAPGLVLGGAIVGAQAATPQFSLRNYGQELTGDLGTITISSLGPFVDYYFNPKNGLHALAAVSYLTASVAEGSPTTDGLHVPAKDLSGTGFSLAAGIGYEWWVGEQWSLGALAAVQYGSATVKSSNDDFEAKLAFLLPGVLGTVTFH
jgi:hypothetical protein